MLRVGFYTNTVASRAKLLLLNPCRDSRLLLFQLVLQYRNFRDLSLDGFLLGLTFVIQCVSALRKLALFALKLLDLVLLHRTQARSVRVSAYCTIVKVLTNLEA